MFVKIKRRGGKTYYELAHSKRTGASVVQYSVYLGTTLALTGQEWLDILATTKFPVSLGRLIPLVQKFIARWNLPRATILGLQDAARMQFSALKTAARKTSSRRRHPASLAHGLLGIAAGATIPQIKAAYRKKVKLCHPDTGGAGSDPALFQRLTDAKDLLVTA
ncbi:MAG: J domain-containing protein, partial [Candidatus Acidiferrales bacterium]